MTEYARNILINSCHYHRASIVNIADYSPFGVLLDGRTVESEDYRYGFQNQEKDDEIKGKGNSVNYKYRMHDPRVGRFFAVDPLAFTYPYNSTYAFCENRIIDGIELEGLERVGYYTPGSGKVSWHDYTKKTDERITEALGWVERYHSGNITASRVKTWSDGWYVIVKNKSDYWKRSTGTELTFYASREDYLNDNPFLIKTDRDFSQWWYSNGDGSEWEGNSEPQGYHIPTEKEKRIAGDVAIIFGGIVTIALTGGAGTFAVIAGITSGSMSTVGGLTKLTLDIKGDYTTSDKTPTGFLNATVGATISYMAGDNSTVQTIKGVLTVIEGVATFNPNNTMLKITGNTLTITNVTLDSEVQGAIKTIFMNVEAN